MFDNLSEKLQEIIRKTSGNSKLTEENMQEAFREIRRALLEADVSLKVVKHFISTIREKAEGEKVVEGVNPTQQLIKIVHDELTTLLGTSQKTLDLTGHPSIIMMLGLQGSGKTTSSVKLAIKLKKEGKNPLLVACDVYRPAAIKQLQTLGKQAEIKVFSQEDCKDVKVIVKGALNYAKENGYNVLILDTAGRLQIDVDMMAELLIIDRMFSPQEKLLVIDSMMGQEAVNVAENFNAQLEITGIVMTKLDGDARGGAALSVVYSTNKPIKLIGIGEKLNALEDFHPSRMADRILGMGDVVSLVEKAQEIFDEKQAIELEKKMRKAEFSYNDFIKIQKQMKMMGSIEGILGMLPGLNIKKDDRQNIAHQGEKQLKKIEVFIQSMTEEERENPSVMNTSRKKRISKGSGLDLAEINAFIKQFEQMRMMMKGFSGMKDKFSKGGKMPKVNPQQMMNMFRK